MYYRTGIKKLLLGKITPYRKVDRRGLRGVANRGFKVY